MSDNNAPKYNKQEIIEHHNRFDSENERGRHVVFDKLWQAINNAAKMGQRRASTAIGPYHEGGAITDTTVGPIADTLKHLRRELEKIGNFNCQQSISHAFQCDCNQKLGCYVYCVVTWDPATL